MSKMANSVVEYEKGKQIMSKLVESYQAAWEELEADLWKMWKATKSDDQDKREELFREYHAGRALQAKLVKVVNEGKKAEEELKQDELKQKKLEQEKVKHGNRHST